MLNFRRVALGCDPEFFFTKDGRVLAAENVLPRDGLIYDRTQLLLSLGTDLADGSSTTAGSKNLKSKIIIDGVQAELNPRPNTCRANLMNEIAACFKTLAHSLPKNNSIGVDFSQAIKLDEKDMKALSDNAKKFGCMPSKNARLGGRETKIKVNPSVYNYRSAGGHIHLGIGGENVIDDAAIHEVLKNPERLVNLLDIIVGNTCVLIDRSQANIERRRVYGRAGEFRTPPHGVEYRTLSNFWLRHSTIASLVFGLARMAVLICADNKDERITKLVDMRDIARAINKNDFDLALTNFDKVIDEIARLAGTNTSDYPLNSYLLPQFRFFVKKGLDHWFNDDPLEHWVGLHDGHSTGFENFLQRVVEPEMYKEARKAIT